MCGILAEVGQQSPAAARQRALDRLRHRGPDHGGQWSAQQPVPVWLGHRRLAIVDTSSAGNQPLHLHAADLHLVGNGEIYNAPALQKTLEALGHVFHSHSDNEAILHAYREWGSDCLAHLEGMFAFVLWDARQQTLLAARDRMGIKPLFYAATPAGGLVLASEASALVGLDGVAQQGYEPQALSHVLAYGHIPDPYAIWRGVNKLSPGQFLRWTPQQGLRLHTYWSPPSQSDAPSDDQAWGQRFEQVLQEHLLSDVPLSLFLSGGLDSTSVAVGVKRLGHQLKAFSLGFPGHPRDESALAQATAERLGHPFEAVVMDGRDLLQQVDAALLQQDEPHLFGSYLTMLNICSAVAKEYKVVLSGDGGDELFAGYNWYRDIPTALPTLAPWKAALAKPLLRHSPLPAALLERARLAFACCSPLHRHAWRTSQRFLPAEVEALLRPAAIRYDDEAFLAPLQRWFTPELPLVRALQRIDLMSFCSNHVCAKVDRASMAHALEVRVPYLDRRLVEWAISRPADPREAQGSKPLIRDYIAPHVPAQVLEQRKQGFSLRTTPPANLESTFVAWIEQSPLISQSILRRDWPRFLRADDRLRAQKLWHLALLARWMHHHPA
ncbi:asparagine synthase (glutamine-hydrolyzing) [Magnetococcus marinus MC-1]|uniref:asparagine synthase (glutamine-hydrolyzing) n=1 Tax=Magnetococcus marinus (strain ATCC BAA-1437 / JCM 17883 / MC-1) TaxID=156889 RepID=A0L551_MAGMM|nr:asparagine synthase (glutamine-hydrolyzing) [Magnetococcus marinus]ABK43094.1 asparagine synthase (glutamine-hydrolyzing) [Magnetococcus marinus MC-1]